MPEVQGRRFDSFVRLCGVLVALVGALWLWLWFTGEAARWSKASIIMKTNMAACLTLAGVSLLLLGGSSTSRARRWAAGASAAAIVVVGSLTLVQNLFGVDLGIDQLLAREPAGALGTAAPNRIGLPGSTSLALVGVALQALSARRRRIVPYLGLAVLVINLMPMIGFLYGIDAFYSRARLTSVAWPTVLSMVTLAAALLVATRDVGPLRLLASAGPAGVMLRRLWPAFVVIALALGFVNVQAAHAGLLEADSRTGLLVLALILSFSTILWSAASQISRSVAAKDAAEHALGRSEADARRRLVEVEALYEVAPLGFALLDPDLRYLRINERLAEINGVPAEAHIGRTVREVVPGIAGQIEPFLLRILETGEPALGLEIQGESPTSPGVPRVWSASWFPLRDAGGHTFAVGAIVDEITERKGADLRLKAALAEKEVLLKEVHHRVKNNLQIVASLVNLQLGGQSDPTTRALLQDVRDRVRTMALVHEKLYGSDHLDRIEFESYARSLLDYLWQSHGSAVQAVSLDLDLQPISLSIETAVPLGLILNELASNALKHAFRGRASGRVTVTQRLGDDHVVTLGVRDDGVGLPPGFDGRQQTSLGLRLVQILTDQLRGKVVTRAPEGGGTEFVISVDLARPA